MAKVKFGAIVTDMRNKVGSQVFSRNRYGAYVRGQKVNVPSATPDQVAARNRLVFFSQNWATLTDDQRTAWNNAVSNFIHTDVFGQKINPCGFDLYVQLNRNLDLVGISPMVMPPIPSTTPNIKDLAIAADAASGVITISFDNSDLSAYYNVIIQCTAGLSTGVNYFRNQLRKITNIIGTAASPANISLAYTNKFGAVPSGKRIGVSAATINILTGQRSPIIYASCISTGLDPSTVILLAAMTTQPSPSEVTAINDMIVALKSNGIWDLLDLLQVYAQDTQQAANLNWKNPAVFTATVTNSCPWTANRGYFPDDISKYIRSGFNPFSDGVQFTQDDCSLGIYVNDTAIADTYPSIGCVDTLGNFIWGYPAYGGNTAYFLLNSSNAIQPGYAVADPLGLTTVRRPDNATMKVNRNGFEIGSHAINSTSIPDLELWVCTFNNDNVNAGASQKSIALCYAGSSAIDDSVLYTIIQAYMVAVGGQA